MENSADTLILVADGFDDTELAHCLAEMKQSQLVTHIVGLRHGLVIGKYGMLLRPDTTISELNHVQARLLILPSGRACTIALMAEPNTHQLIEQFCNNAHFVAAFDAYVQTILANTGNSARSCSYFLQPDNTSILSFIKSLPNHIL